MDIDITQKKIIDETHEFAQKRIKPIARDIDAKGEYPKTLIEELASHRFLSTTFPKNYGGLGLDPVYYGLFTEEIGKACSATRALITLQTSVIGETLSRWGSVPQKEKWLRGISSGNKIGAFALTEPNIGSDARNVQSTYSKHGKEYVINGHKRWISFGVIADFFIVIAKGDERVTAFIIEHDTNGVKVTPMKGLMAGRASHIAEVEFNNVHVPEQNILGTEGGGFDYIVNTSLDHGRYSVAWGGVACAQAALESMVAYARSRNQFGKKIHNFQLIKGLIGDAVTETHAARALCIRVGELRRKKDPDSIAETMIAKYFAAKTAMKVAADAVQIHGGDGFCNLYPAERLFRESKVLGVIEGTNQIHQEFIANHGLRKYGERKRQ